MLKPEFPLPIRFPDQHRPSLHSTVCAMRIQKGMLANAAVV
jgi:hypothetical protein